jgi:hypothetical protein
MGEVMTALWQGQMTTVVRQGFSGRACLLFRVILEPFDFAQDRLREESRFFFFPSPG